MPPGLYRALSPPKIKKTCPANNHTVKALQYNSACYNLAYYNSACYTLAYYSTTWCTTTWRTTTWCTTIRRTTTEPIMAGREFRAQLSSGLWLPCSQRAISIAWDITTTEGISGSQLSSGLWLPIKKPFLAQADSSCHAFKGAVISPERWPLREAFLALNYQANYGCPLAPEPTN